MKKLFLKYLVRYYIVNERYGVYLSVTSAATIIAYDVSIPLIFLSGLIIPGWPALIIASTVALSLFMYTHIYYLQNKEFVLKLVEESWDMKIPWLTIFVEVAVTTLLLIYSLNLNTDHW